MKSRKDRSLSKEFARFQKQKSKHPDTWHGVDIVISNDDITTWYVRITGLSDVYTGGEYLVKMVAGKNHPDDPPKYYFMTPNGLYALGHNACISIGSYHKDEYPAVLGMTGFIMNVIGAMLQWRTLGEGIKLLDTSAEKKKQLAGESYNFNREHHIDIISMFET